MIRRDPTAAAASDYDLIVVGGGVYGCALALEAARRNLRPLLLERDDFGQHTSWNSLRIVHGGLRYLQTLDLRRFAESVAERAWFLAHFPDLVEPLPCLMPLYDRGLRRRPILRAAMAVNDLLSRHRNDGLDPDRHLPDGRIVSRDEVLARFPAADRAGLVGGALWYDAVMPDPQRVILAILHWATSRGATALNYVEADSLVTSAGRVDGVTARDSRDGRDLTFRAPVVVNCTGPWSGTVAQRLDRGVPELFRPSLALNVLLDVVPPFDTAVAVTAHERGARTYFLYPWKGRTLAGTYHAPWNADDPPADAPLDHTERFLAEVRAAIPGWSISSRDVRRVLWGLLPATASNSVDLVGRELIHDHAAHGGPVGLFSVSGVKFTTARRVAERTLHRIVARRSGTLDGATPSDRPPGDTPPTWPAFERLLSDDPDAARRLVERMISDEAVVDLSDLMLRRTDWGILAPDAGAAADRVAALIGWPAQRPRARSGSPGGGS